MTNQPHLLDEILGILRAQHRQIEPPSSVEAGIRAALSSQRPAVSRRRWIWTFAFVPVLVALIIWVAVRLPSLRRPVQIQSPASAPGEMVQLEPATDFILLPSAETLPPPREIRIWRVRIAKGELAQYGFSVPPTTAAEPIYADFVVGEDGFPREIRCFR